MDLAQLWADDEAPPPKLLDVLTHIAHFLDQLGYTKTFSALYKEAKKNDLIIDIAEWERGIQAKTAIPLLDLYEEWYDANQKHPTLPDSDDEEGGASVDSGSDDSGSEDESEKNAAEGVLVDVEAEETSDDDSDEDGSSGSDNDSDSGRADPTPSKPGVKRKRVETPSSSEDSSSDDSDSDSSESTSAHNDHRPAKKTKVEKSASSDSDSSSSDSDSDSSSSSSDSDSDSASGESTSSSDSSDSDSSSSSESEKETQKKPVASKKKDQKKKKDPVKTEAPKTQAKDNGSTSSATLEGESAGEKEDDSNGPGQVHPDRLKQMPPTTKKETAAAAKKQVVPFSRIPADQKVDARFASNAYVSYDYADRAHRDLIVTKGKGFTKEKNKKKRGAYRGGAIDLTPKGIKFDD